MRRVCSNGRDRDVAEEDIREDGPLGRAVPAAVGPADAGIPEGRSEADMELGDCERSLSFTAEHTEANRIQVLTTKSCAACSATNYTSFTI